MRKLLESMDKFAGEPEQKPGDQVRGKDNPKKGSKQHGFANRLVGESDEFTKELMLEYSRFISLPEADVPGNPTSPVANINPPGQGVKKPGEENTDQEDDGTQKPETPLNQQPNPAQQAAMKQKQQADLNRNLSSLKTIDPTINVAKVQQALNKDPNQLTGIDAGPLGALANTLKPVISNPQAMSQLKGQIQKLIPKA